MLYYALVTDSLQFLSIYFVFGLYSDMKKNYGNCHEELQHCGLDALSSFSARRPQPHGVKFTLIGSQGLRSHCLRSLKSTEVVFYFQEQTLWYGCKYSSV